MLTPELLGKNYLGTVWWSFWLHGTFVIKGTCKVSRCTVRIAQGSVAEYKDVSNDSEHVFLSWQWPSPLWQTSSHFNRTCLVCWSLHAVCACRRWLHGRHEIVRAGVSRVRQQVEDVERKLTSEEECEHTAHNFTLAAAPKSRTSVPLSSVFCTHTWSSFALAHASVKQTSYDRRKTRDFSQKVPISLIT